MKKTEMVKKFIEKIEKIEGVEVEYKQFNYWNNQPVCVVDDKHITWFVDTYYHGNSQGICCVSETMTTKELKEFFEYTLIKIQDALEEQKKYSIEIKKMLEV